MQGPEWLLAELLGGFGAAHGRPQPPPPRAVLEAQAAVVADVGQRKAELDALGAWAAGALSEARLANASDAAARRQLRVAAARLQATLNGIDRKLGGFLEAEEVRAEATRRAAYAGYMAGVGPVQGWLRTGPAAREAVRWALGQLGDPYHWGAAGQDAFDCSGLTSAAYRAVGVAIPRVSVAQWGAGPHPDVAALLPGDLVFYGDDARNPATIYHVGIYIGNGLMVQAPHTGDVVRVAGLPPADTPPAPPTMTTTASRPSPASAPPSRTSAPPVPTTAAPTTAVPAPTTTVPPTATTAPPTTVATTTTIPPTTTTAPPTTMASTTTTAPTTTALPTTAAPPAT